MDKHLIKIFIVSLILLSSTLTDCLAIRSLAASAEPDTLIKVEAPSRLVITESSRETRFIVSGKGDTPFEISVAAEYPAEGSVTSSQASRQMDVSDAFRICGFNLRDNDSVKWDIVVDGICIGLNNPLNQRPGSGIQWSKSFEISWLNAIGVSYSFGKTAISLGLGFDWRNYRSTTSDRMMVRTDDRGLRWENVPEGMKLRFSRLKVFSLQLPLLFRARIPGTSLHLKAGPIFNFNTYASLKNKFEDPQGNESEFFSKRLSPRRFTIDLFGSLSLCNVVGIYVRYSPMKVMDSGQFNFNPLTAGISFGL